MKQKEWSSLQIKKALSLSQEVDSSIKGISINSKTLKKNNLNIYINGWYHPYCTLFEEYYYKYVLKNKNEDKIKNETEKLIYKSRKTMDMFLPYILLYNITEQYNQNN